MFHETRLTSRAAPILIVSGTPEIIDAIGRDENLYRSSIQEISTNELAFRTLVEFKAHPHLNNVLTHISGGDWRKVEQSLCFILDPSAEKRERSRLTKNILDLMCADRGVTGRILKPRLHEFLYRTVEPRIAAMLIWRITVLFLGLEWTVWPLEGRPATREIVAAPAAL
jgi:hypothetical protein